jgi:methionyl aminopeptidase
MIKLKTKEEIEIMSQGGKILARTMRELERNVRPGITTLELDRLAESLLLNSGGKCSFKGYGGQTEEPYPFCLCASVNEEIVHAVPSERVLKEGDIISLDLGVEYKGFHSDMAITVPVGKVSALAKRLIENTRRALEVGIAEIKPQNRIGDASRAIQRYIEGEGFGVVRELCGHGIGSKLHEDPEILNSVSSDKATVDKADYFGAAKIVMKEGMVLCFEPMVTVGDWHIKKSRDGFGLETKDGSLSAHFEHTIAVTKEGHLVLTEI